MNESVLYELAHKWDRDAKTPECQDGSPDAQRSNDIAEGIRKGKRECADCLRSLIQLIGDKS